MVRALTASRFFRWQEVPKGQRRLTRNILGNQEDPALRPWGKFPDGNILFCTSGALGRERSCETQPFPGPRPRPLKTYATPTP